MTPMRRFPERGRCRTKAATEREKAGKKFQQLRRKRKGTQHTQGDPGLHSPGT